MLVNLVKEKIADIEHSVEYLAQTCRNAADVPVRVRDVITEMERQADQAKQTIYHAPSNESLRQYLDRLEQLGEVASQACSETPQVDAQIQEALVKAKEAVTLFKQQLH